MFRLFAALFVLGLVAACGAPPVRFATPSVESGGRIGVAFRSVEVREVSLPTYARSEEIWRETPEGALESDASILWADEPTRGVTQELTRHLAAISGARVAAEPWPFDDLPAARVEVRMDEMVAGADGRFRIAGQFYTGSTEGERNRAGRFRITAPIAPDSGVRGVTAARAQAVRDLARQIASEGL